MIKKEKASTANSSKRKSGGQKGHEGKNLKMVERPDKVIISSAEVCSNCGVSLEGATSHLNASRQVFDIPVLKMEVTEYQVHTKRCPCCKTINKGSFSERSGRYKGDGYTSKLRRSGCA
ncbi:MAG TPA: IS66 family transposase zinc-finger binding domain-containing protein [Campylobacterales bacterium]|nr:IS66 family transposase zinc-finger binding domain-containing protein [Campylobacterales bacterium]